MLKLKEDFLTKLNTFLARIENLESEDSWYEDGGGFESGDAHSTQNQEYYTAVLLQRVVESEHKDLTKSAEEVIEAVKTSL